MSNEIVINCDDLYDEVFNEDGTFREDDSCFRGGSHAAVAPGADGGFAIGPDHDDDLHDDNDIDETAGGGAPIRQKKSTQRRSNNNSNSNNGNKQPASSSSAPTSGPTVVGVFGGMPVEDFDVGGDDHNDDDDNNDPDSHLDLGDAPDYSRDGYTFVERTLNEYNAVFCNHLLNPAASEFYMEHDPMAEVDLSNILPPHVPYSKEETLREQGPDFNTAQNMSDDSDAASSVTSQQMQEDQDLEGMETDEGFLEGKRSSVVEQEKKAATAAAKAAGDDTAEPVDVAAYGPNSQEDYCPPEMDGAPPSEWPRRVCVAQRIGTVPHQQGGGAAKAASTGSQLIVDVVAATSGIGGASPDDLYWYAMRSSPASRYMMRRAGVIFSVGKDENRVQVAERLAKDPVVGKMFEGGPDGKRPGTVPLQCGYELREPVGLAIALPNNKAERELLLRHLPEARLSKLSWADFSLFLKEKRIKSMGASALTSNNNDGSGNGNSAASASLEQRKKALRATPKKLRVMQFNDANLLATYVNQLGGWDKATFVCMDVEAACMRGYEAPQPLELALYGRKQRTGENGEIEEIKYHSFVHPGYVVQQTTAAMLSLGHFSGSHGIPYRNNKTLRTDYKKMATELDHFFVDNAENFIFIYKGNTAADIDAFRFVYAAANDEWGSIPVIHAFSLSCLARALELEPELCRPALRSTTGVDMHWVQLTECVEKASLPFLADGKKEDKDGKEPIGVTALKAEFGGELPKLVPGKKCPPLPQSFIPTYCESCWFHSRPDTLERNGDVHCALWDAQLTSHRVTQMIQLSKANKAAREKFFASKKLEKERAEEVAAAAADSKGSKGSNVAKE